LLRFPFGIRTRVFWSWGGFNVHCARVPHFFPKTCWRFCCKFVSGRIGTRAWKFIFIF
jgi:hypothetical protein